MMKRVLHLTVLAVLLAFMSQSAFAIPAIQIYIPDATWQAVSQTWVTGASDFELWIIAANTDSKPIYNLTLVAALAEGQAPISGALTVDGTDYNSFTYGSPPSWGSDAGDYPNHGIYPTNYLELEFAALVNSYSETVHNMQPGQYADTAPGEIFKFQVSTSYDLVHFDGFGYHDESDGHFKFVPNSHDGEKGDRPPVPEPATMLLVGLGMAGVAVTRRKLQ